MLCRPLYRLHNLFNFVLKLLSLTPSVGDSSGSGSGGGGGGGGGSSSSSSNMSSCSCYFKILCSLFFYVCM